MKKEKTKVNHQLRIRQLKVKSFENLTPTLKKITIHGNELKDFQSNSPEDHVKVFFPNGGTEPVLPIKDESGTILNSNEVIMRDYTPVDFREEELELDLIFSLHKHGPASLWASKVRIGDSIAIGGPRASLVYPEFQNYLLMGDDSAIASFIRRISQTDYAKKINAIIAIKDESEKFVFSNNPCLKIHWIVNQDQKSLTQDFISLFKTIDVQDEDLHTVISGEATLVSDLKHFLIEERAFNPEWIRATTYWKSEP